MPFSPGQAIPKAKPVPVAVASPPAPRPAPKPKAEPKTTVEPKILDWHVLEPIFKDLKSRGIDLGTHMFRNKKFDVSSAGFLIDIYRKLKQEGYR